MLLPKELTKDLKTRLKSISGQLEGIVKMLDEDRSPKDLLQQVNSAEKGLANAHKLLLDEVYRKTLAIQIVHAVEACPGNCGNEEKIEGLRQQFPDLQSEELAQKMEELEDVHIWLGEYLKSRDKASVLIHK